MQRLSYFFIILFAAITARGAGFPQISTDGNEHFYYLKFVQGNYVVRATEENAVCKSALPTGKASQLWKVEGSAAEGYTFTNKLGQKLYATGTTEGSAINASIAPTSGEKFHINTSGTNYTITPFSNKDQAFNCWGGMGLGNDIKLYRSNDANAPITFLTEDEVSISGTKVNVIPYPSNVNSTNEGSLDMHNVVAITYAEDMTKDMAQQFADDIKRTAGIELRVEKASVNASEHSEKIISLLPNPALSTEAYTLRVGSFGVEITAADFGGYFYALQTLRQLLPTAIYGQTLATKADWTIPSVKITDKPQLSYRGFHLDVSRHFFDKDEVKKLLDVAAIYKLNRFHWHLTDDQGWRIEIPEYPKLTTVGAVRSRSLTINDPTNGAEFYDDTEYGRGMFYTLNDLREIVAYAQERNIEIIPEVDMPGHMVAAVASYPELSCNPNKKYEVRTEKGISTDVLNVGKDEVIDFLKCVMGHVAEVFPYELVHIGGDECPTTVWQNNEDCQRRIQEEGLSGVNDLQPWLVEKIGSFLRDEYGKRVLIWDDFIANWKSSYTIEPVVMIWRGTGDPTTALSHNFQSVMVPSYPLYFDLLQQSPSSMEIDAPYFGGYGDRAVNTVEHVYAFNPVAKASGKENFIVGTQANLWTESCPTNKAAEYMYFPRLLALSEMAWLPANKKDFSGFYIRLQKHVEILDAKNVVYAKHYIEAPDLTAAEKALQTAQQILTDSNPGEVGHPEQTAFDNLKTAAETLQATPESAEKLVNLLEEINNYKAAPICQPEEGEFYRIISASTFFRNHYLGSALYATGDEARIHYTEQTEPEELWQFEKNSNGSFNLKNVLTGKYLSLKTTDNTAAQMTQTGSSIHIRKAMKPAGGYDFIPGVVNIKTGRFNMYAQMSGQIVSSLDSTLCYAGTWRIEKVADFAERVRGIRQKAEYILETAQPNKVGQPTESALEFLRQQVLAAASAALESGSVSKDIYLEIADLYNQFLQMETISAFDVIDSNKYYYLRNAYFTEYYACANSSTNIVDSKKQGGTDGYKWRFVKNSDGTVSIESKLTKTGAYVSSNAENQQIRLGRDAKWSIRQVSTDTGSEGLAFVYGTGSYGWYTNPSAWSYVLLKPYTWGASVWELEESGDEVVGISNLSNNNSSTRLAVKYDASGRVSKGAQPGVYIQEGKKVLSR